MKLKMNVPERMKHYNVIGLSMAFIEHGQLRGTNCYGVLEADTTKPVDPHSMFSACSISKFLTGVLAMRCVERNLLQLDEDVNLKLVSWKVPESELTVHKKVTLRNLLSHQSGIKDPEESFEELNSLEGIPSMVSILNGETSYCKNRIKVCYEPESEFHYSDAGYCIIQQLIEDVTGKSFQHVVDEMIFKPLHMDQSTLDMATLKTDNFNFACGHNKNGEIVSGKYPLYPYPAAAGLWTTPFDLAQLLLDVMKALKGESNIGILPGTAKEMLTAQKGKTWAGLGVFLDDAGEEFEISSLGWGVGFQCMLVAYPYAEKGVVIMTNGELGVHQMKGIIGEIYKSIVF